MLQAGGVALVWHAAYGLGAKCCAESWTQTLGVTSAAKLKGSIGEGPNHSNFSDQSSVNVVS